MRRLLGVLREDAGGDRDPAAAAGPASSSTTCVDEARDAAGGSTRLIVRGAVAPLDPGVELTAYRIVQEALTNARRHAPGAAVDVELHYARRRAAAAGPRQRPGPARPAGSPPGTACSACASGPRRSAARCGPAPAPTGGFLVEAILPTGDR